MVNELIGLQDNKVDLRYASKIPKDQQVGFYICPHLFLEDLSVMVDDNAISCL